VTEGVADYWPFDLVDLVDGDDDREVVAESVQIDRLAHSAEPGDLLEVDGRRVPSKITRK
jgi:hypothetical protein